MHLMPPTSVLGVLAGLVLVTTVVYAVPSLKIVVHELWTWSRNRSES